MANPQCVMRRRNSRASVFVFLLVLATSLIAIDGRQALAHGGGLDSNGGHNCYVPSCAGTYHCHRAWGPRCGGGAPTPSPLPTVKPSIGSSCISLAGTTLSWTDVMLIQSALSSRGYSPGPIDGVLGAKTSAALNRFEAKRGLPKSSRGFVNNRSISALSISC
jgi:hypothetical protein